jgi:hypothetical protein
MNAQDEAFSSQPMELPKYLQEALYQYSKEVLADREFFNLQIKFKRHGNYYNTHKLADIVISDEVTSTSIGH